MNWIVFAISALTAMVLEMSLIHLLDIAGMRPSVLAIMALFIALWAPRLHALWGCYLCGLLIDLTSALTYDGGLVAHLAGPNALGFVFAAALTLQVRSMVLRRQLFATAALTLMFVLAASIVVVAIGTIRSWYSPESMGFSAVADLGQRVGVAVYTALLAVPLGWLLLRSASWWRFAVNPTSMKTNWR